MYDDSTPTLYSHSTAQQYRHQHGNMVRRDEIAAILSRALTDSCGGHEARTVLRLANQMGFTASELSDTAPAPHPLRSDAKPSDPDYRPKPPKLCVGSSPDCQAQCPALLNQNVEHPAIRCDLCAMVFLTNEALRQ